jgi:transposase
MTKYREILRLKHLGFSERNIARTAGVSRNTVKRVVEAATAAKIDWTHAESMDDATIEKALFPDRKPAQPSYTIDFEYIRKELLRNGVTKKLLWTEYCESCRLCNREPLMYSQFCHYIQQEEQKRKATMHIPRRPAETVEVDWAGDPAHVIDPDRVNSWTPTCSSRRCRTASMGS